MGSARITGIRRSGPSHDAFYSLYLADGKINQLVEVFMTGPRKGQVEPAGGAHQGFIVGNSGREDVPTGLAWADGALYLVGESWRQLIRLDPETGLRQELIVPPGGLFGVSEYDPAGLAPKRTGFGSATTGDDALWLVNDSSATGRRLYSLDTATGLATLWGTLPAGLASTAGLAAVGDDLYVFSDTNAGHLYRLSPSYENNTHAVSATLLGSTNATGALYGDSVPRGLAAIGDTLYASFGTRRQIMKIAVADLPTDNQAASTTPIQFTPFGTGFQHAKVNEGNNKRMELAAVYRALWLSAPSSSPSFDTTPTFTVVVPETGVDIELHSNSTCTSAISSTVSNTTKAARDTVNITTSALAAGSHTVYAKYTDAANRAICSLTGAAYTVQTDLLAATVGDPAPAGPARQKTVALSSVAAGSAVVYKLLDDRPCNATTYSASGATETTVTLTANAATITLDEEAESHKYLCLKLTKASATDTYLASKFISGIDRTAPSQSASITLKSPSSSPGTDPTPTFTVGLPEQFVGGHTKRYASVELHSNSSCSSLISSAAISMSGVISYSTISSSRYLAQDVTITARTGKGPHTVYAKYTDAAGNSAVCSSTSASYTLNQSATVGAPLPAGAAKQKTIAVSGVASGTTGNYRLILDAVCNATNYNGAEVPAVSVTFSSGSATITVNNETANNRYLCLKLTSSSYDTAYAGSAQITGIDRTVPANTGTVALKSPSSSPATDTTPTLTVTVPEDGLTVALHDNSSCSSAISGSVTVNDADSPHTVDVTANELTVGTRTIYARYADAADNAVCTSSGVSYQVQFSLAVLPSGAARQKTVTITNVAAGATARYKLLSSSTCNATNYGAGAGVLIGLDSNRLGSVTLAQESYNTKYLCVKIAKAGSTDVYLGSAQITGIDRTAPLRGTLFMVGAMVLAIMGQQEPGSVLSGVDTPAAPAAETVPAPPAGGGTDEPQ